jgi:hypothetical protein
VKIDTEIRTSDHRLGEQMGQTRTQRAAFRAWKAAIEITAIGQVPRPLNEPERIDERDRKHRARKRSRIDPSHDLVDDHHTVELVTV